MLRTFLLLVTIGLLCSAKPLITKEDIEELKQKATWTVTEYEENVFKGIEDEDFAQGSPELKNLRYAESRRENSKEIKSDSLDCGLPVLNMGDSCFGSSFAFAVAGMVSMRCCMKNGKNEGWLSPMELISCDDSNYGCAGGWPAYAVKYVEKNGLVPNECYPYNGQNEGCPNVCKNGKSFKEAHKCNITNIVNLKSKDAALKALEKGPIVLSFESYADMYTYKEGIYCHTAGAFKRVISAVAISYSDTPSPHIKFLMPFGESFGEKGYMRMCTDCCGMFGRYDKGNVGCDMK